MPEDFDQLLKFFKESLNWETIVSGLAVPIILSLLAFFYKSILSFCKNIASVIVEYVARDKTKTGLQRLHEVAAIKIDLKAQEIANIKKMIANNIPKKTYPILHQFIKGNGYIRFDNPIDEELDSISLAITVLEDKGWIARKGRGVIKIDDNVLIACREYFAGRH